MPKSRARKPKQRVAARRQGTPAAPAWEDVPLIAAPTPDAAPGPRTARDDAPPRPSSALEALRDLERVTRDLAALRDRRAALLARRAALVEDLRAAGTSWATLTAVTGTSRQGLQRLGGGS